METRYRKQQNALRHLLLGRGWNDACRALEFAGAHHTGTRKDGATPAMAHQVAIALWAWTLEPLLTYPQETVIAALLHDTPEDYGIGFDELGGLFSKAVDGRRIVGAVRALTKEHRGARFPQDEVDAAIASDPIASIVKPGDRINNQHTMVGVFSPAKIAEYVDETEQHILPVLKRARRTFPEQEQAYQNAKLTLEAQVRLLRLVPVPAPVR